MPWSSRLLRLLLVIRLRTKRLALRLRQILWLWLSKLREEQRIGTRRLLLYRLWLLLWLLQMLALRLLVLCLLSYYGHMRLSSLWLERCLE